MGNGWRPTRRAAARHHWLIAVVAPGASMSSELYRQTFTVLDKRLWRFPPSSRLPAATRRSSHATVRQLDSAVSTVPPATATYLRSGMPWLSGTLLVAMRTMSISAQIPQPPRVNSLPRPSPVLPR